MPKNLMYDKTTFISHTILQNMQNDPIEDSAKIIVIEIKVDWNTIHKIRLSKENQ